MNVRIFWVRAMKCMCAQTRPRFILSSERVLGGIEYEPMLTPREKSPLPENFPRGGSNVKHLTWPTTCTVPTDHWQGVGLQCRTPGIRSRVEFLLCLIGCRTPCVSHWQIYPDHCLAGLVVKASASRATDPGFDFRLCQGDSSESSHTGDLKVGTPVATLPGAWRDRSSAGTCLPGVSILWLGEVESLICNFSEWQHIKLSEQIRPWNTLAWCWDVKQPTNRLPRPLYALPLWDRSCRSNLLLHPVTVYWHRASQSQHWPYNTRRLADKPLENSLPSVTRWKTTSKSGLALNGISYYGKPRTARSGGSWL